MEMAKVTSKGQITIPISIRRRLNIKEGDKLLFIDRPEGVMMVNPDMLGSSQETEVSGTEPAAVATASETPAATPAAIAEKEADKPQVPQPTKTEDLEVSKPPPDTPKPTPDRAGKKSTATVGNLNLDSLLDEIRSIGRKI